MYTISGYHWDEMFDMFVAFSVKKSCPSKVESNLEVNA